MGDGPLFDARDIVVAHGARPTLRPYQVRSVEQLREHRAAGLRRLLLTQPTGGGKTLTASEIIRSALSMGRRVLFVVHLRELVDQTVEAFHALGISHIGVMRGDDERVDADAPVQIASIQTLARRDKPLADVIILDEAHRSIAASYVKHVWTAYPEAVVIGLTASPCRGDGRPLGERYQALVIGATYSDLIAAKFIDEPIVFAPQHPPNLANVKRVAGDWDDGELEEEMAKIVGDIVPEWIARAEGRKTIVFASGISHSKDIVRRFVEAGVRAEHLDGTTPDSERIAILARLGSGATTVVSNCAVLTEGFNLPSIRCAVIARPTLSLVIHIQTAGRALRHGEQRPIILDHAGNVERHGMPHQNRDWKIDGPPVAPKLANPYKTCKVCFVYMPVGAKLCPHCRAVQPLRPRELPKEEKGSMVAVSTAALELSFYEAQVSKAEYMGFKPGFAGARFKDKFGRWPPWSWSEATKQRCACDEDWQARIEKRAREKAWREDSEAKAEAARTEDHDAAPVDTSGLVEADTDFDFGANVVDDGIPF